MSTDTCSTQLGETNAGVTRSRNDATELKATILVLSDPESGSLHAFYKAVEETIAVGPECPEP